jgi:hypothetical protein
MADRPDRQERETQQRNPPPLQSLIISILSAFENQYHQYKREREQKDAQHQRNEGMMAQWTRRVGIFTIVLAFLAAVSAVIFYHQLSVMQGQLSEMKAAAKQTDEAIKINRQYLIASNRAFVYLEPPEITPHIDVVKHIKSWQMTIGIGNSGNTPTKNLFYGIACPSNDAELEKFFDKGETVPFILGPKVKIKPNACSVDTPDTVIKPDNVVFVATVAHYMDTIDDRIPHITEACYVMNFATSNLGTSDLIALGSPCRTARNHNCADDECKK